MSVGLFFRTEMSGGDDENIKLNVCPIGMDGSVVSFYVKKTTALRKVKNSYSEKNGVESHTLRFCFEGARIGDGDTAENLQLKEGDTIEVFPALVGPGNVRFTIHYWVFYVFICRLSRNREVAEDLELEEGDMIEVIEMGNMRLTIG